MHLRLTAHIRREIVYMEGVPDLSDSNTTNTILTRHPDFTCMVHCLRLGSVYLMDDQKTQMYKPVSLHINGRVKT